MPNGLPQRRRMGAALAALLVPALLTAQPPAPMPRIEVQPSGVPSLLQAMHAVNESVVWAVGGPAVLRTYDGGGTWSRIPAPGGDSLEFRDVHAVHADTAWILAIGEGLKSRIYHTTDGGGSWTLQFLNRDSTAFYDCFSFGTRREAVVFGDASSGRTNLLRTTDAGRTWSLLSPTDIPAPLPGEGAFAASGRCVAHADSANVFVATGAPGARLFRSRDAGRTWSVENTPFVRGTAAGLTGIAFRAGGYAMAVGADINHLRNDTSTSVVGVTPDGGRTWTMRTRPPLPGALAGVAWVPVARETAVVSGYGGAFWTADDGRSWTVVTDQVSAGLTTYGHRAWIGGRGRIWRVEW